jgi:single-strand DNA-binding protein
MNLNKAFIIGNITRDPEIKKLPSGVSVCNFSVATNRMWENKDTGKKEQEVEYHSIVVFGKIADNVAFYMRKGSQILIEGRIKTRFWADKSGAKQYKTEIIAESVQFGAKPTQTEPNEPPQGIEYPGGDINPINIPF